MGTVIMHNVVSVDGFMTDDVESLHEWYFSQDLAGERTIAVNAGDVGSQILAAALVDEVAMDVVPVVFGSGKRYFGGIQDQHLLDDPHVVIQGESGAAPAVQSPSRRLTFDPRSGGAP